VPEYVASIGMEVHAELDTESKMFCRCAVAFGGEPNTRVCPVCLGLPGSLPVPNQRAIEFVMRTALALNCNIARRSIFHRKNYFYPDLPKGYQVSQYEETNPIGYHGWLEIPSGEGYKTIRIRRVHLEEDTGKLLHLPAGGSGVDYNRAGVPLMEIVTDFPPDIENADEAKEYLVQLRNILIYLGVCNGKMEEGALRCEPNISIRLAGAETLGTKTELKNLNSFRSVQLGSQFEVRRQAAVLEQGGKVLQETRGWNEATESSFLMRTKESENDYRYFPDPDLPPMVFDEAFVERVRASLPELPLAKFRRYREEWGLSAYDANWLIADHETAEWFEEAVGLKGDPKATFNWMSSDFAKMLNDQGLSPRQSKVTPATLVEMSSMIDSGAISGKIAKDVFKEMFASGRSPSEVVAVSGLTQISDTDTIVAAARKAIETNPDPLAKYRSGQTGVLGFFVGQVMKETGGRANPQMVQDIVRRLLDEQI